MDITESAIQSEMTESDVVSEVRKDMKSLRKNLKIGRVQLLNWNENQEEIEETYKEFKNMSKMIKKKLKGLLYKEKSQEGGKNEDKNIPSTFSRKRDQICPKSRFFRQCFAMFLSYEKIIATILSDFTGGYFNFCKLRKS